MPCSGRLRGRLLRFRGGDGDGAAGPVDQFGGAFEDCGRDFVVAHGQRLAAGLVGEGAHAVGEVSLFGLRAGFEEEPAFVEDGEEMVALIQAVRPEQGAGADIAQGAELIEHKFFEGVVGHGVIIKEPPALTSYSPAFPARLGPVDNSGAGDDERVDFVGFPAFPPVIHRALTVNNPVHINSWADPENVLI